MVPPAPTLLQQWWLPTPAYLQQWWLPKSMVCAIHLLHINSNQPNNHPLCHLYGATSFYFFSTSLHPVAYHYESVFGQVYRYLPHLSITRVTKAHLFSDKRITTTRWSAISHLKGVNAYLRDTTFPFERINHARSGMIIKPHIKAYNTPSNGNFYFQVRQ